MNLTKVIRRGWVRRVKVKASHRTDNRRVDLRFRIIRSLIESKYWSKP